jgi:hypothetical protein
MKQKLVPFCCWLNHTHLDTYLHGPFNFATVNGWNTCNRIAQHDWDILSCQGVQFQNLLPWFDYPSYSIHINRGVHFTICDSSHTAALCAVSNLDIDCLYHYQRSLVYSVYYPLLHFGAAKRNLSAGMLATTSQTRQVSLCSSKGSAITICDHHLLSSASLVLLAT